MRNEEMSLTAYRYLSLSHSRILRDYLQLERYVRSSIEAPVAPERDSNAINKKEISISQLNSSCNYSVGEELNQRVSMYGSILQSKKKSLGSFLVD